MMNLEFSNYYKLIQLQLIILILIAVSNPLRSQDIENMSLESLLEIEINTAAKYNQKVNEIAAPVHIITAEEIAIHGYQTIEDVLNTIPGFYSSYDRNYNYTGVRGFSRPSDYSNRILFLLDGHKLNENYYGSVDAGNMYNGINFKSLKRIEIIEGPGSVLYGTGAMFAVINLISKDENDVSSRSVAAEGGSYGKLGGDLSFGQEYGNGLKVLLTGAIYQSTGQDLYYEEFDDPSTNNGIASGIDGEKYHGLHLALSYGNFRLHGMATSRTKAIPTGAWDIIFNDKSSKTVDNYTYLELVYKHNLNAAQQLIMRTYLDEYYYTGIYPYEDLDENDEPYPYFWWDKNVSLRAGAEALFLWDTHTNNRLICGFEYQNNPRVYFREWDSWDTGFGGNYEYSILSVFAQNEYQLRRNLSITGGLRYDTYSNMGGFLTPRLAAILNISEKRTLKLLYGVAFRAPTTYERYYQDMSYGYKSNPDLKQEQISSTDIIYTEQIHSKVLLSAGIYNYSLTDLIDPVVDPSDGNIIHKNSSAIVSSGIELKLSTTLNKRQQGYLSYSYNSAGDELTGDQLTNSPEHLFKSGGHMAFSKYLIVGADLRYETERKTVYGEDIKAYVLGDLNLSSSLFNEGVNLSLRIQNIFDTEYANPGGLEHIQPAILQDGRNFIL